MILLAVVAAVAAQTPPFAVERARVLAFSEDGTRALVEERTVGPRRENLVRYVVLGPKGRELEVTPELSARIAPGVRAELVDPEACRSDRDALEKALTGFRTVRVRQGSCGELVRRALVEELTTPPPPLAAGSEDLLALQKKFPVLGEFWVSDDGPIVVVIGPDPNSLVGFGVVERVFQRADPRVNKRWPDPPG